MPETDRLGYARGILEQLRASHQHLSNEELLDLVCHLTKTYVLDQTIPFDVPLPERAEELRGDPPDVSPTPEETDESSDDPAHSRFARLIEGLKRRTRLPQFEGFTVEDGKVVLVVDNQKVTFGERVTVEFIPGRATERRRPSDVGQRVRPPGAPPPEPREAAPQRPPKSSTAKPANPPPRQEAEEDEGPDPSVERFRRLDLD